MTSLPTTAAAFAHRQSAHCESGVVANMVTHGGLAMNEPMAFGLSSALTFAYVPIVKMAGMPLIAYRMPPGHIIKGVARQLGMTWKRQTFADPAAGKAALDAALDEGRVVGLQTCVYWLPYFPEDMRFHFNAHNLVVYGRDGDDYLISDPIFEQPVRCDSASLEKARFAKGAMAAKGMMYYPQGAPSEIDYARAVPKAIAANRRIMVGAPLPVIGVKGIRFLGRNIAKVAAGADAATQLPKYLGHIVRMQEEIGTGGAGFRFLYASFLQEAGRLLDRPVLKEASEALTDAGDDWRRFALQATKMCRGRAKMDVKELDAILNRIADKELAVWGMLKS
jgi:hypothetical protein